MNTTTISKSRAQRIGPNTLWAAGLVLVLAIVAIAVFSYNALRPAQPPAHPIAGSGEVASQSSDMLKRIQLARSLGVR